MNGSEKVDWNLEAYNQICQRDRTDGNIFWNKVNVLIGVSFGLLGVLSLKNCEAPRQPFILMISVSGLIFSIFWGFVLLRQAGWVEFWKGKLRDMERDVKVNLAVQTSGDYFAKNEMCCILRIGSYKVVAWLLPLAFFILWAILLIWLSTITP